VKGRWRVAWLVALAAGAGAGCGGDGAPRAVGTLERDRIELTAEAPEPILEIPVREGDMVAAGDRVVRLDPERFTARVRMAQGARDRAQARLDELARGPRRERIDEGRARLSGAEGVFETARHDLERAKELSAQSVASRSRLDEQRARFDEARAERDGARAALEALLEGTTTEELDQARAGLAEAEAALDEARVQEERLDVRAPVAGRVDALPFEVGERPPTGATVAVLLADQAPYARAYVPEAVRSHVAPGSAARVHVDGVDRSFAGRVRSVSADSSFTPFFALTERDRGRLVYVAKIDLVEPEARALPSGVPVEVELVLEP